MHESRTCQCYWCQIGAEHRFVCLECLSEKTPLNILSCYCLVTCLVTSKPYIHAAAKPLTILAYNRLLPCSRLELAVQKISSHQGTR